MNYETLFKDARSKTVRAAITGAGEFGTSLIFQSRRVPGLQVRAVANRTPERAVKAFTHAGIASAEVRVCTSTAEARDAFDRGRCVVVRDAALLMDLPLDVLVEGTGLKPDNARFHAPIARTAEIPDILCPAKNGGLLTGTGVLDVVNCLRRPDEPSLGGGVFVVVTCHDDTSWRVLEAKGHPLSRDGNRAMLYHPAHLLGLEAPISVLAAALLGHATGAEELRPVCDLAARATQDLKAGTRLEIRGHHHTIDGTEGLLVDGFRAGGGNPFPYYMLGDAVLCRDVPAGETITGDAVQPAEQATLARLRDDQDRHFGSGDFNPDAIP
jgi:predicted homoserine dehydrogenase-like protein